MGKLLVLSDAHVRTMLLSLSKETVQRIAARLSESLKDYSSGDAACAGAATQQAPRTVRTRPDGVVNLFMPAMSSTAMASKLLGVPSATAAPSSGTPQRTAPRGAMLVLRPDGDPLAVLGAEELTAFRTALGALLLFPRRKHVRNILVFGAGKQAIWHIRLALVLRGSDVRSITVVNRSPARTTAMLAELEKDDRSKWLVHESLEIKAGAEGLGPGSPAHGAEIEELVEAADVIFCTTPSTAPLFGAELLTRSGKGRYVTAIGSYKPHMKELDPEVIRFATAGGKPVFVDSREGALEESGEIIDAGIGGGQLAELGELFGGQTIGNDNASMESWLKEGFLLYKGVGSGVMDVSVAEMLVLLAHETASGVLVDGF
ncbi:hypothetical protein BJ166DRAFT_569137 [Pestalotiopsis sp. NC0098]|nr:hypothetical protein BJ166DRAFT_569137 [Pestalotiopsis sp. NC0098]